MEIGSLFENGAIITTEGTVSADGIAYNPHAKFKEVSLKHLVTGEMTDNKNSSLIYCLMP